MNVRPQILKFHGNVPSTRSCLPLCQPGSRMWRSFQHSDHSLTYCTFLLFLSFWVSPHLLIISGHSGWSFDHSSSISSLQVFLSTNESYIPKTDWGSRVRCDNYTHRKSLLVHNPIFLRFYSARRRFLGYENVFCEYGGLAPYLHSISACVPQRNRRVSQDDKCSLGFRHHASFSPTIISLWPLTQYHQRASGLQREEDWNMDWQLRWSR